jgi:Family of unknown function (DUF6188)
MAPRREALKLRIAHPGGHPPVVIRKVRAGMADTSRGDDHEVMPRILHSDGSVHEGRSVAPAEVLLPAISGVDLTYFRIDGQIRLQFGDVEVQITRFVLRRGNEEWTLDGVTELGPLLELFPDTLDSISVDTEATLRLGFRSGARIDVAVDPRYEAWQIAGPGEALIVCPPSGQPGLAVWSDREETT